MRIFSYHSMPLFHKHKHPQEDYFLIDENRSIVSIADGVTQREYKEGISHAYEVAKIFCRSSIDYIRKKYDSIDKNNIFHIEDMFFNAFRISNQNIKKYNEERGVTAKTIDYFNLDYYETVGLLCMIYKDNIYIGRIGDCGFTLMSNDGYVKSQSYNIWKGVGKCLDDEIRKTTQDHLEFLHRYLRNNPFLYTCDGERCGYGVLNGEDNALLFFEFYVIKKDREDILFLYTDGFESRIRDHNFREKIINIVNENTDSIIDRLVELDGEFSKKMPSYDDERTLILIV